MATVFSAWKSEKYINDIHSYLHESQVIVSRLKGLVKRERFA